MLWTVVLAAFLASAIRLLRRRDWFREQHEKTLSNKF